MPERRLSELALVQDTQGLDSLPQLVAPLYGFSEEAQIDLLNLSENATYKLSEASTTGVLRIHRSGYHTLQEIASELAFCEALREEAGVSTPVVRPSTRGASIMIMRSQPLPDERFAVMFDELPGSEPDRDDLLGWCQSLGEVTARIHDHGRRWRTPPWFDRFGWTFDTIAGRLARWGRWQDSPELDGDSLSLLQQTHDAIEARLLRFGTDRDRFGLIHADIRLGNLMVDGSDLTVIDFDDLGYGWFLWDLATIFTFIEDHPRLEEAVELWLSGYHSVTPVAPEIEAEVPTFIMLRRLQVLAWLAWHSETELAEQEAPQYVATSCELAERFLSRF